jgi:putative ABC transport system permease protein
MTIGEIWRRVIHLVRSRRAADDLRDEMRLHMELRAQALGGDRITDAEVRAAARRQFGNEVVLREASRDQWGLLWADHLVRDVHYATRRLVQRPGFSVAVVGVLALGIGATTATFSAVDAAMLRPLPFADPGHLVVLRHISIPFDAGGASFYGGGARGVEIGDVEKMHDTFSNAAVYAAGGFNLADPQHPTRVNVGVVSGDFFGTLGAIPTLGRAFNASDEFPNGPNIVILSYGLWQRQYGGSAMLGKSITLNNQPYQVVGVMARGFGFPSESDLWIPMSIPNTFATFAAFRGSLFASFIARLAPGVTSEAAAERLVAQFERRAADEVPRPGQKKFLGQTLKEVVADGPLAPLQRELTGDRRTALVVLLGATLLLLLITCANVTNLLLSQAAARRHEIAVRAVLGASRWRIVRQLLTEAVILATTGTLIGVALAPAILGTMRALMPSQLNGLAPATVDLRVLGFAAALALVTGIGFGLWPALGFTRDASGETVKAGARSATGRNAGRARRALVGIELALTVVLLVGSMLMLRSFSRLMSQDRGMQTEHVGTLEIAFGTSAGAGRVRMRKVDAILARVSAIPGITSAGAINDLPLRGGGGISIRVMPDVGQPEGTDLAGGRYLMASGGYFATMGIPVKRGRTFTAADDSLAPRVAVISESMASRFWPGVDAVGHTFTMGPPDSIRVVGVVANVRERKLESDPAPQMYFPIAESGPDNVAIVARGTLAPGALLARMRESVRAADPTQAIYNVRMMDDVVSNSVAPRRTNTVLISMFALLALVLSAIGIYAVVSYSVSQRSREFGIRTALGADSRQILNLVVGEMAWVLLAGLLSGVAGAWALSRVLTSMIYGVSVHDPWTFAVAPLALLVPALLAAVVPARRATRVNPAEVMRAD